MAGSSNGRVRPPHPSPLTPMHELPGLVGSFVSNAADGHRQHCWCQVSGVWCQVSGVRCQVSGVRVFIQRAAADSLGADPAAPHWIRHDTAAVHEIGPAEAGHRHVPSPYSRPPAKGSPRHRSITAYRTTIVATPSPQAITKYSSDTLDTRLR